MGLVLDLFSGTGSATQPFVECGKHRVIRIDVDPKCHPDVVADVRHLPLRFKEPPEFVWASPPCREYSYARAWKKDWPEPDRSAWEAALNVPARHKVIENVSGARRWWGPAPHRGPYYLWTDLILPTFPTFPRKTAKRPGRTWGTGRGSAVIPRPLAEAVHRAVCEP